MKRSKVVLFILMLVFAVLSALTLSACGKEFTVTFDGNGGFLLSGEVEQTVTKSSKLDPPIFGRNGYDQSGWDIDLKSIKSDTTVKAVWTVSKYSIIFDFKGGKETESNPREYTIESEDIILFAPEKTGYEFVGWTGTGYTSATKSITIKSGSYGPKTFTANWMIKKYDINYQLNGGVFVTSTPDSYTITSNDQHIADPVRKGYEFLGWTGTGLSEPTKSVVIPVGSYGEREYVANWKANEYSISFDLNGGTYDGQPTIDDRIVEFDSALGVLPVPDNENMIFDGWYYGDERLSASTIFNYEENITVQARYSENYTIKFILTSQVGNVDVVCYYNGESTKEDVVLARGEKLPELLDAVPSPKYSDNYDFENWVYVNAEGQEIVVTKDTVFEQSVFSYSTIYLIAKCKPGPWTPPVDIG